MTEDKYQEREQHFATLKLKHQATGYEDSSPSSPLYSILKRLDAKKRLNDDEVNWLKSHELVETLTIFQQQESAREAKFAELKAKYQATKHPESSISSPLYKMLRNLEAGRPLYESELNWLKEQELAETFEIAQELTAQELEKKQHFAELKMKYKATQYYDSSPTSHLYRILKQLDSGSPISHSDINFLSKRQLTETIAIAVDEYIAILQSDVDIDNLLSPAATSEQPVESETPDDTVSAEEHFAYLKSKYGVSGYQNKSPSNQLYAILLKLEQGERLKSTEVAWLKDKHLFYSDSDIFITYHQIEANFYEPEYKRTGNKWNLPSASSHWRSAKQPERALKLTDNLNIDIIKDNKLKSALLTTRGGAYRDIGELDEAEKCAQQAIEYQPNGHHPYTLMGVLGYERGEYAEGDDWFQEAIKRGGSPRDIDAEIKRVIKNANKDDCLKVVGYLVKKEPVRYKWANTLMGILCYERGEYSEGDDWFEEAIKHGASPRAQDADVKRAIKNADDDKRREVVEHLLKKDQVRYKWANAMLN